MGNELTDGQVRMLRLRTQRLYPPGKRKGLAVAWLVAGLGGIQAQSKEVAALGRKRYRGNRGC